MSDSDDDTVVQVHPTARRPGYDPSIEYVQFLDAGNGSSTLILHSASVYGQSDLGKNKERVEDLLKRISDLPANMTATAVSV